MVAAQITGAKPGVQPMPGNVSQILDMVNARTEWTDWRKTTSLWPRKSISGKIIIGQINKRSKNSFQGSRHIGGHKIRIREFATDKELFTAKLKGEV